MALVKMDLNFEFTKLVGVSDDGKKGHLHNDDNAGHVGLSNSIR